MQRRGIARVLATALGALVAIGGIAASSTAAEAAVRAARGAPPARLSSQLTPSRVLMRLSVPSVISGRDVMATIVVVPRTAGREVSLQRQGPGHWLDLSEGTTDATGRVVLRVTPQIGSYRIRAYVAPSAFSAEAISPTDSLQVSPVPPPYAGAAALAPGDSGPQVVALQQRLTQLGYWVGAANGAFGDATEQAVYALQKAAGLTPDGDVGASTVAALQRGVQPIPRPAAGYLIEVSLEKDLVMFVNNGAIVHVLNTSTGGGYSYYQGGATYQAITPRGIFSINRTVDGLVVDQLGSLWRPRFFYEGFAIHGDSYVPPYPVSHGCVRVSNEAIDWIWAGNLAPVGTEVWVY